MEEDLVYGAIFTLYVALFILILGYICVRRVAKREMQEKEKVATDGEEDKNTKKNK